MGEISKEKSEAPTLGVVVKIVQLYLGNEEERTKMQNPVFAWGDADCNNHPDVLRDCLEGRSLDFELCADGKSPETRGKEYVVVGMGLARLTSDGELIVEKHSESLAYRLTPFEKHIEQIRQYLPSEIKDIRLTK